MTEEVWRAWRIARKKDPELYTPNNFFKSKYGNQRVLHSRTPKFGETSISWLVSLCVICNGPRHRTVAKPQRRSE